MVLRSCPVTCMSTWPSHCPSPQGNNWQTSWKAVWYISCCSHTHTAQAYRIPPPNNAGVLSVECVLHSRARDSQLERFPQGKWTCVHLPWGRHPLCRRVSSVLCHLFCWCRTKSVRAAEREKDDGTWVPPNLPSPSFILPLCTPFHPETPSPSLPHPANPHCQLTNTSGCSQLH